MPSANLELQLLSFPNSKGFFLKVSPRHCLFQGNLKIKTNGSSAQTSQGSCCQIPDLASGVSFRTTLILGVHTTSFQMLVQHVFIDFCLHSELQIQVGELYISSHVHVLYIYHIPI